ncbi:hypothetical protein SC206_12175 [Rouxiella sp. T17]|uniref:hypothetical protein n=1 Tax=Rouxiella sp. T17 TaxID=3085684 RepID=UPI002FCB8854
MRKYVIYINNNKSKVLPKELATRAFTKKMKQRGFRKHHVEIDAKNEQDAIVKLNENSQEYLDSLKELSGSAVICAICGGVVALIYFIKFW